MPRTSHYETNGLDQHVGLIKQQLDKSMKDGAVRQLAVQIVSGTNDHATDPRTGDTVPIIRAFGRQFLAEIDTFATARESLLAGGGDCDDATILIAALAGFVGFRAVARVISTQDNPKQWVHIYPLIGISKDDPKQWIPLDVTVEGAAPGWEYESIANYRDYTLV